MRFLGHPVHPALVHFPIAGWVLAAGSDGAWLILGDPFWLRAAFTLQLTGVVVAYLAAIAGFSDLGALKEKPAATKTALEHIFFMLLALLSATASVIGRIKISLAEELHSNEWIFAASFAAAAFVLIGAFFGGSLVYKFGLGTTKYVKDKNEENAS